MMRSECFWRESFCFGGEAEREREWRSREEIDKLFSVVVLWVSPTKQASLDRTPPAILLYLTRSFFPLSFPFDACHEG